jgi:hypothetical protein
MAIGFNSKMGGMFGARPQFGTPGFGDGMQQEQAPHAYQQQAPKPEGEDKTKRIIGIIGDALLGLGGQQGIYGPMMMRKRLQEQAMQRQQQMAEQSRQWAREDKQWEWDNKPATGEEYTYFEDNAGNRWRQHKGTGAVDQNPTFIDRTPKEFVHEGMRFSIPNPYLRGEGGGSADDAPTVEDGFAYTPGPGGRANPANWKPEGGAGSNASGGFLDAFRGGI